MMRVLLLLILSKIMINTIFKAALCSSWYAAANRIETDPPNTVRGWYLQNQITEGMHRSQQQHERCRLHDVLDS
jgi:hypothetical protein